MIGLRTNISPEIVTEIKKADLNLLENIPKGVKEEVVKLVTKSHDLDHVSFWYGKDLVNRPALKYRGQITRSNDILKSETDIVKYTRDRVDGRLSYVPISNKNVCKNV